MCLCADFSVFSNEATLVNIRNGRQIAVDFLYHSKNWRKELKAIKATKLTNCCVLEYQVDRWGDPTGTADEITSITDNFVSDDFQTLNAAIDAEWREDFITLLGRVQRGELVAYEDITTDDAAIEFYRERFGAASVEKWSDLDKFGCLTAYGWLDYSRLIVG